MPVIIVKVTKSLIEKRSFFGGGPFYQSLRYIDIVVTIYSVLRGKKKREKRLKDALSTLHNTQHTRQQVFYAWKQETHIDLVFITGET